MPLLFWIDIIGLCVSTLITGSMTLLVVGVDPRSHGNRAFGFFTGSMVLWTGAALLLRLSLWLEPVLPISLFLPNPYLWLMIVTASVPLTCILSLMFTATYLRRRSRWTDLAIVSGLLLIILLLARSLVSKGAVIAAVRLDANGLIVHDITTVAKVAMGAFYFFIVASILLFWRDRHRTGANYLALSLLVLLLGLVSRSFVYAPFPMNSFSNTLCAVLLAYGVISKQIFNPLRVRTIELSKEVELRRDVERTLRINEERLRLIAENAKVVIWMMDMNLRYTYISPYIKHNMGYTPEEYVLKPLNEVLTPSSLELCMRLFGQELEEEKNPRRDLLRSRTIEVEHIQRDGRIIWAELNMTFIRDTEGKAIGILGITSDITERKETSRQLKNKNIELTAAYEQLSASGQQLTEKINELAKSELQMRESEAFRKRVFDSSRVPIVVMDATTFQYIDCNPAAVEIYQFTSREDTLGKTPLDVSAPLQYDGTPSQERVLFYISKAISEGKVVFEWRHQRPDGEIWDAEVHLMSFQSGRRKLLQFTLEDITERKRIEKSLHEIEARYSLIMNNITDRIWLTDMNFKILWASESVSQNRGWQIEEITPLPFEKLLTPKSLEMGLKTVSEELTPQRLQQKDLDISKTLELEFYRKDGSAFWSEVTLKVLRDQEGMPVSILGVGRDITDRKRAEEEKGMLEERLNRAEKMELLGQLAGGVAHDLNNVLGVLSGYSELLLEEAPEGSRSRGHVEKILQSTEKGAAIISDLLTLARRGVITSVVVNLNSIVSDFLKTPVFEGIRNHHPGVTFRTAYDNELLSIKGSKIHLEKTLMNLVSNAAEAISRKGEVTIRTESRYLDEPLQGYDEVNEGDYAILIVSDTGEGITAENKGKIFEPFYSKKAIGRSGTGLGLTIVWGTVKDHNGYIDLQTKVGEGTTFSLYFPVTREEQTAQPQKIPIESYMGKGESVLVVDDIAEQRDIARGLLTRLGYKVHSVPSGVEAVEYLKKQKADILVLDMIMAPEIDGLETYKRVLEINPKQKAILVSGFSETERVMKAQEIGAGAYIKKPYTTEKIGIAIRDELGRK